MNKYLTPTAEVIALRTEYAVLGSSEIIMDDDTKADHFDTHSHTDWTVNWDDSADE